MDEVAREEHGVARTHRMKRAKERLRQNQRAVKASSRETVSPSGFVTTSLLRTGGDRGGNSDALR